MLLRIGADGGVEKRWKLKGPCPDPTTNIRMEMTAVIKALDRLGVVTGEPITVYCDLSLIPASMNRDLAKWKAKGWRLANNKPVKNQDLWEEIERASEGRNVTFMWIKGHAGQEFNELADELARKGVEEAKRMAPGEATA